VNRCSITNGPARLSGSVRFVGILLAASTLFSFSDCAPAQVPSCGNDHECESLGANFHYCLNARCVECVTSAACGAGRRCGGGACVSQ
jgi:hypothetical protein